MAEKCVGIYIINDSDSFKLTSFLSERVKPVCMQWFDP